MSWKRFLDSVRKLSPLVRRVFTDLWKKMREKFTLKDSISFGKDLLEKANEARKKDEEEEGREERSKMIEEAAMQKAEEKAEEEMEKESAVMEEETEAEEEEDDLELGCQRSDPFTGLGF